MNYKIVTTLVLLIASQCALAGKVVVFDHQEAIMGTNFAQQKVKELQAKPEYAQMIAQAESLRSDLEALSKEASTKGMTWSAEERAEQRKKQEYIQADLKLAAQKIQSENGALMNAIAAEIQPKLEDVLTKLVTAENIDIVLRKQATYIALPAVDITAQVSEALNNTK